MKTMDPIFGLKNNSCLKQVLFLICSSLFPMCTNDVPRPIYPCRNICELVQRNCANEQVMKYWPKFLNCEKLPQNENKELCLNMPEELRINSSSNSIIPSSNRVLSDPLDDEDDEEDDRIDESSMNEIQKRDQVQSQIHSSDPINVNHHQTSFWWKLTQSQNMYNKVATLATCPTNFTINDMGTCSYACGTDAFFSTLQKKIVETFILVFSVLCFIFTLFSLITFWTESTRFQFPERPAIFLTLCYNLLSTSYLFRTFHQKSTAVAQNVDELNGFNNEITAIKSEDVVSNQCAVDSQCLAYFIIINYLVICASFWFFIFGICWWLSTSKQWSPEALQKKSGLFHIFAWLLPLAFPSGALLFGTIRKNELTGMCSAYGFTEIPASILLIFGAFFIILSAKSIIVLRSSWKNAKLSSVMRRILVFGTFYFLPSFISCLLMFWEYDNQLGACLPGEICYQPVKRSVDMIILRYACLFIGGVSGQWLWSKKTCISCRQKLQYSASQSPVAQPDGSKNIAYSKYVSSIQRSLLNNNYHRNRSSKKDICGIHRTTEHVDWIPSPCI